jgi:hypothetical protein
MKQMRSTQSVRLRYNLAQLLKRLRAIARTSLPEHELAARLNTELMTAGEAGRFVSVTTRASAGHRRYVALVDKDRLREAEGGYSDSSTRRIAPQMAADRA